MSESPMTDGSNDRDNEQRENQEQKDFEDDDDQVVFEDQIGGSPRGNWEGEVSDHICYVVLQDTQGYSSNKHAVKVCGVFYTKSSAERRRNEVYMELQGSTRDEIDCCERGAISVWVELSHMFRR
jgi:hypothetical protein